MQQKALVYLFLMGSLLGTLTSCHTSRNATNAPSALTDTVSIGTGNPLPAGVEIKTLNAPKCQLSINFSGQSFTVASSVKIVRDTVIQISITPILGIEMYRAVLTPDSVFLINKNNKEYSSAGYDFIQQKTGVDIHFSDVQNLLLNHALDTDKGNSSLNITYSYTNTSVLKQTTITQHEDTFTCTYSRFQQTGDTVFPTAYTMEINAGGKQGSLSFSYDKFTVNNNLTINQLDLSKYRKVPYTRILPF